MQPAGIYTYIDAILLSEKVISIAATFFFFCYYFHVLFTQMVIREHYARNDTILSANSALRDVVPRASCAAMERKSRTSLFSQLRKMCSVLSVVNINSTIIRGLFFLFLLLRRVVTPLLITLYLSGKIIRRQTRFQRIHRIVRDQCLTALSSIEFGSHGVSSADAAIRTSRACALPFGPCQAPFVIHTSSFKHSGLCRANAPEA